MDSAMPLLAASSRIRNLVIVAGSVALGGTAVGASAQVANSPEPPAGIAPASETEVGSFALADPPVSPWEVSITPYLWVAGVDGSLDIPRRAGDAIEIDRSFTDILGNLKFAFMGAVDVRHGRFVALTDIIYLSVGAEAESVRNPAFLEGEVDASAFVGTGAVGYRVVDRGPLFVDLFAGGRLVALDVEVTLTGPLQTRERETSPSNVSALVGGRARIPLGDKWGLLLYGDVGSLFGSSDVKWQVAGTVQHDLSRHWRLVAGYRYMSLHHDKRDSDIDVDLSGPLLGISYTF